MASALLGLDLKCSVGEDKLDPSSSLHWWYIHILYCTNFVDLIINTKRGTNSEIIIMVYKYLGIWIDEKISFKNCISNLVSKLRQKIGFFFNKSCFSLHCRKTIVERSEHCRKLLKQLSISLRLHLMQACFGCDFKPFDAVYHSAFRFITGDAYMIHHCILFKSLAGPFSLRCGICICICLFTRPLLESCLLILLPC